MYLFVEKSQAKRKLTEKKFFSCLFATENKEENLVEVIWFRVKSTGLQAKLDKAYEPPGILVPVLDSVESAFLTKTADANVLGPWTHFKWRGTDFLPRRGRDV